MLSEHNVHSVSADMIYFAMCTYHFNLVSDLFFLQLTRLILFVALVLSTMLFLAGCYSCPSLPFSWLFVYLFVAAAFFSLCVLLLSLWGWLNKGTIRHFSPDLQPHSQHNPTDRSRLYDFCELFQLVLFYFLQCSLSHTQLGSPCACICGCVLCCAVLCCATIVVMCCVVPLWSCRSLTPSSVNSNERIRTVCVCALCACMGVCMRAIDMHTYSLSQSLMDIMFRRAYARDAHHTHRCSFAYVCTSVDMCMQRCVFVSILLSLISTLLLSTQFMHVYEWFCTNSHRHADIRTHIHTHRRAHVEPYWKQNTKPLTLNMSR